MCQISVHGLNLFQTENSQQFLIAAEEHIGFTGLLSNWITKANVVELIIEEIFLFPRAITTWVIEVDFKFVENIS